MYIGIDAGGTKTDICICDADGNIAARDISEGMNAARSGPEACAQHFARRLRGLGICGARSLYAGVAGAGAPETAAALAAALRRELPGIERIAAASDAFNALNGEVGLSDGIALIAGTGSSAFIRMNGAARQVGGRGYLIDDAGSGYWTGRACLNAAYRSLDGRGPATALLGAAEKRLGMPLADGIPEIYRGGAAFVASFAPLVFEQAEKGDATAVSIAEACADELCLHLKACLGVCDSPPGVCVASGGMFRSEFLRKKLTERARTLGLNMLFPDIPPVCGAVIAAAGEHADGRFTENLKNAFRG